MHRISDGNSSDDDDDDGNMGEQRTPNPTPDDKWPAALRPSKIAKAALAMIDGDDGDGASEGVCVVGGVGGDNDMMRHHL